MVWPHPRLIAHRHSDTQSRARRGGQLGCQHSTYSAQGCVNQAATTLTCRCRATVEELASDGQVDVALRRNKFAAAVEITVITDIEHEIRNVEKCLAAGLGSVVLVCGESRRAARCQNAIEDLSFAFRVTVLVPEALVDFFAQYDMPAMRLARWFEALRCEKPVSGVQAFAITVRVSKG